MNGPIDWTQYALGTRIRYYLLRGAYRLSAALNGRTEADRRSADAAHRLGLDTEEDVS